MPQSKSAGRKLHPGVVDYALGITDGEWLPPAASKLPPPTEPHKVAQQFATHFGDGRELVRWRGDFWHWYGSSWRAVEEEAAEAWVYRFAGDATYVQGDNRKPWAPDKTKVNKVLDALAALVHVGEGKQPPVWLGRARFTARGAVVSCANGLLDVETRQCSGHDPSFFNQIAVPFAYDRDAPEPVRWLRLMDECWPEDPASIAALQEWFGYVLSGRLDQQKILHVHGPGRSGKGTIAKVLAKLVGEESVAYPALGSFEKSFGLSNLIAKSLAIFTDAGSRSSAAVVEKLKSISGEDAQSIERKYKVDWNGQLLTRLMVLSNEEPNFQDPSGVLPTRFLSLELTKSHVGEEDLGLIGGLEPEMPGVLNWALDGLDRLLEQGRFTQPAGAEETLARMQALSSPVHAFVQDVCVTGPDLEVDKDTLYREYRGWAISNDSTPLDKSHFASKLKSVVSGLKEKRPRSGSNTRKRNWTGVGLRAKA